MCINNLDLHHIGYAVQSICDSWHEFQLLGYKSCGSIVEDKKRLVKILFIQGYGLKIELIEPLSGKSPINTILQKQGPTPYHLCYLVSDLTETVDQLQKNGFRLLTKPDQALAIQNKQVVFMYSSHIGLIELVEREKHDNK